MACDDCACQAEAQKYKRAVDARVSLAENQARVQAQQMTEQSSASHYSDSVCVPSTWKNPSVAALAAFQKKAKARAAGIEKELQRIYTKGFFNFNANNSVPLPDCSKCLPCQPGQSPTCSVCAAPNVVYQNRCVSLCGEFLTNVNPQYFANCGLNSAFQPVACCNVILPGQTAFSAICNPTKSSAPCP
jgi:hypothetical protein